MPKYKVDTPNGVQIITASTAEEAVRLAQINRSSEPYYHAVHQAHKLMWHRGKLVGCNGCRTKTKRSKAHGKRNCKKRGKD